MKAAQRKRESYRTNGRYSRGKTHKGGPVQAKLAVVRRAFFEGGTFDIIEIPSGIMLRQGFESMETAQLIADSINQKEQVK